MSHELLKVFESSQSQSLLQDLTKNSNQKKQLTDMFVLSLTINQFVNTNDTT